MTTRTETVWFDVLRRDMVEVQLRRRGIRDQRVLEAMARVPRHEFAGERYRDQAYEDHPLPIGNGQTISQPYIVALMLEALELEPDNIVLEVGTGSGYVTALLAELAQQVFSIERHEALAESARDLIACLGYTNVKIIAGDGTQGYPPAAPFDAILVSAAAPDLPPALIAQLAESGRMIIPVGSGDAQQLQLVRIEDGQAEVQLGERCRFVPLVSDVSS